MCRPSLAADDKAALALLRKFSLSFTTDYQKAFHDILKAQSSDPDAIRNIKTLVNNIVKFNLEQKMTAARMGNDGTKFAQLNTLHSWFCHQNPDFQARVYKTFAEDPVRFADKLINQYQQHLPRQAPVPNQYHGNPYTGRYR